MDFQALYQVMRKDEPQTIRAQSRVAIEEIKDDSVSIGVKDFIAKYAILIHFVVTVIIMLYSMQEI